MTFHISRDSGNFDSIRGEVAEQNLSRIEPSKLSLAPILLAKLLGDLLDDVNLKLV